MNKISKEIRPGGGVKYLTSGFTLVEVLAVITLMSILAVITTPVITGLVDNAKKSSFKNSASGLIKASEFYYDKYMSDDYAIDDFTTDENGDNYLKYQEFTFTKGEISKDDNGNTIEYKGASPTSGFIKIYVNGLISLAISNNKYVACKAAGSDTITVGSRTLGDACAVNDDGDVVDGPMINQSEWQNTINKIQKDLLDHEERITVLEKEVKDLKIKNTNQDASIESLNNSYTNLNSQVKTNKEDISDLKMKYATLGAENDSLTGSITVSNETIKNLQSDITSIKTKNTSQDASIEILNTSYTNLNKKLTTNETDITSIKEKNTNQDASITALNASYNTLDGKVKTNTNDIASIKSKNTSQDASIETLNTSYTNLNKKVTTNQTDIESIKSKNTNQDASIASLQTAVETLKKNVDSAGTTTTILDKAYPVGSIYVSTSSTNPSALFGGTWEVYGAGRTLVGKSTSLTAGATGGSNSITLSESQMPSHSHSVTATGSVSSTFTGNQATTSSNGSHSHTVTAKGSVSSTFTGTAVTTSSDGNHAHTSMVAWDGQRGVSSPISGNHQYLLYQPTNPYGINTNKAGAHTHTVTAKGTVSSSFTGSSATTSTQSAHTHTLTPTGSVSSIFTGTKATTTSSGSGSSIDIRNPYVVVYMWKRTA